MIAHIREYLPTDFEFIRRLFVEYLDSERERIPGLTISPAFPDQYLPRLVQQAIDLQGTIFVAEIAGVPSGFIAALPKAKPDPWDESRTKAVLIMELHIDIGHRRQGIGRALLRAVEDRFRAKGFDWISLGVFSANAHARSMYSAEGFRDIYSFMGKQLS